MSRRAVYSFSMRTTVLALSVALLVALVPGRLAAHHAFAAEFDANKKVTLKGTIAKMEWVNPHAWLWIDVEGKDGTVENWALEFGPPNALFRRGWRKSSLPVGAAVTATGYLAKDGRKVANADKVTLPDGSVLSAGSSGAGAPPKRK